MRASSLCAVLGLCVISLVARPVPSWAAGTATPPVVSPASPDQTGFSPPGIRPAFVDGPLEPLGVWVTSQRPFRPAGRYEVWWSDWTGTAKTRVSSPVKWTRLDPKGTVFQGHTLYVLTFRGSAPVLSTSPITLTFDPPASDEFLLWLRNTVQKPRHFYVVYLRPLTPSADPVADHIPSPAKLISFAKVAGGPVPVLPRELTPPLAPESPPPKAADTSGPIRFAEATSSAPGPTAYPKEDGCLRLEVNLTKGGTIVDTVGINAASPGDFALEVSDAGVLTWRIYGPAVASALKDRSGWHVLRSRAALKKGRWQTVAATYGRRGMSLAVNGKSEPVAPAKLALSGSPVFLGDFPGDASWGAAHHPDRSFIGDLRGVSFGP